MLPKSLIGGFDKRRLKNLLGFFFLGLAIPTVVLIWQAYSQLKWEAFHQYRGVAEELTRRIDDRLTDVINTADARSFADYTFLVITGDPRANFLQRSPLSAYPVAADLPGVLGYFQVDPDGAFSTPILPAAGRDPQQLGIDADEYTNRVQLARDIQSILADNRLLQSRTGIGLRRDLALFAEPPGPATAAFEEAKTGTLQPATVGGFMDANSNHKDALESIDTVLQEQAATAGNTYSQQVFDVLNTGKTGTLELDDLAGRARAANERFKAVAKVADLKLDAALQKKSEDVERVEAEEQRKQGGRAAATSRAKRKERIALPESTAFAAPIERQRASNIAALTDLRISTFESEIDPLEFSLLDSGHFVLFRKVWRDGERYIQGLLIDQHALIDDVINSRFMETTLSEMSNLIVAYQDSVIHTFRGRDTVGRDYSNETLQDTLLYQSHLSAPLDSLELIYSIKRLPPGPGARVLAWVTLILALVFLGGFYTLYRLGLSQINLARQQQDFVSAVSHELKTPLTSIRMYAEMLKEGWADEEKRQSYYEFIHNESERLTRLISNVLQLARITRNEAQFDSKPVVVGELISQIEPKIANQVGHAGFELKFKRDDQTDRASINIDADCFVQIIINLVDNAIKFSSNAEVKRIEISSKLASNNKVGFAVRDFGPGIPRDQMKKIFTLFYRSESELTRETVGTCIGLAIVHQLTIAMNGKIDVINRDPGAEFRVSFSNSSSA